MEKKIVTLTREQFEIYRTCKVNPFYLANFVYIIHPVKGKVKFNLYEYQRAVLWNFLNNRFNIILKFRQAGLTELIAFFCLWLAMFNDNKNIQIISIKDMVAKRVLKRIKYMYKNLPEWLQTPVTQIRGDSFGTATVLEFVNGSSITSVPTTEEAGRSEAVSLLVIDEAAIVRWADRIWAAAFPTLSTGGSAILNSCVTGDTEIVTKEGPLRIDTVCPKEMGIKDISHLGIEVLSHTGKWRKVTHSVNKGILKTWELEDEQGNTLRCTPAHKLYTTDGWRSVGRIVREGLNIITFDTGFKKLETKKTEKPSIEIFKNIPGYPKYMLSNWGKLYIKDGDSLIEKEPMLGNSGYYRFKLWANGESKNFSVSRLVAKLFIGDIPDGYVVDHIDCDHSHNYVTNLQILSQLENTKRAVNLSPTFKVAPSVGDKFPDILLIGKIKEKYQKYGNSYGSSKIIMREIEDELGLRVNASYISRVINNKRVTKVNISKLKLVNITYENIYDISVEEDQSYICNSLYINHNTPMGIGNFFHKQWVDAKNGDSYFNPIRLYWQMHPERNEEWYNSMAKSLGPRRTAQEIDGDFLSSGNTVFDLNCIRAIEECLPYPDDYLSIEQNGKLFIRRFAKPGERCFIGADVAIGRANDYSAFSVMNRYGEELAYFRGKINPSKYANLLMHTGKRFNNALIAPESNDIGLAVTSKIQDHGYPNLYYAKKLLKKKGKSKPEVEDIPGWYTTTSTRPIIIDELEEDIRFDQVNICNKFFVDESYTFIFDSRNRPVAMGKDRANDDNIYDDDAVYTDDCIMAEAITNYIRKGKKNLVTNPI